MPDPTRTTPALPLTITPHHIWGYDIKIWLIIDIILAIGAGSLFFVIDELRDLILVAPLLLLGVLAIHVVFHLFNRGKSLTLTDKGIEVKTPKQTTFVPFEKLEPVYRGVSYVGGRSFRALPIVSKELNVQVVPNTLNWGSRDLDTFYVAIPNQYKDKDAKQWW